MATTHHIQLRRALVAALAAAALGSALPDRAAAYGWPVKPFHQQHPVRGFFGDPRITDHGTSRNFHFGVDISAPNGTAVYATLSGRIFLENPEVVTISDGHGREFSYWHIVPVVRTGSYATAYRTLLGHIEAPWAHVHFAEARAGVWVNPLRPGGMAPFVDRTRPVVRAVQVESGGRVRALSAVSRSIALVADVRDTTPLFVPQPWSDLPVMPALVRWRIVGVTSWSVAANFRYTIPPESAFDSYFARWTRQNRAKRPGRYRLYLTNGWNTAAVRDGRYTVEVVASDVSRNSTRFTTSLVVRNHPRTR
jgi:hypothetical protein